MTEGEFSGSRSNHPKYVIRYTCDGEGDKFAEGIARRRTRAALAGNEPNVEVAYDRSRHVIQITREGEDTAEFEERPARFLLMDRDPRTKAVKPVLEWGSLGSIRGPDRAPPRWTRPRRPEPHLDPRLSSRRRARTRSTLRCRLHAGRRGG